MSDPDLPDLDRAASAAARGLRDHVERHLDPEPGLARIPLDAPRNRGGRVLVAAVVTLLVLGGLALAGNQGGRVRIDEERRHPIPPPMALAPLGPTDGKASMGLPVEVEPATGLHDKQRVQAHGTGFNPGESVGVVQCTREAGPTSAGGTGSGVDACNLGSYTAVTADADGAVSGSYVVQRFLTTSLTGTVDCASEAGRCLVAIGAVSDYDRSGGFGLEFVAGEPGDGPEIPTLSVSPAEGLADGDMVRVRGEGYEPGSVAFLQICSADPSGCWATGEALEDEGSVGLKVDEHGRVDGEVPAWQFLPTSEPGRYADCAVSACSLRIQDTGLETAPAPVPLRFAPGHPGPTGPSFTVDPNTGLAPTAKVDLTGGGFVKGTQLQVTFCVGAGPFDPTAPVGASGVCTSIGDVLEVHDDGTVVGQVTLPDPTTLDSGCTNCLQVPTTTACGGAGCAEAASTSTVATGAPWCDGVQNHCTISLDSQYTELVVTRPFFAPPPVTVTYAPR